MDLISLVTDFGDLAVVVPLTLAILVWLLWLGKRREALWWCLAVIFCAGGTAVLKISFFACPPVEDLHSPSGHTALSLLVYGGIAAIVAVEREGWRRRLVVALAASFIGAIAISRVLIDAHTILEVVTGLFVGLAPLACFVAVYHKRHAGRVEVRPIVVAAILIAVIMNGQVVRAEDFLHSVSGYLDVAQLCS